MEVMYLTNSERTYILPIAEPNDALCAAEAPDDAYAFVYVTRDESGLRRPEQARRYLGGQCDASRVHALKTHAYRAENRPPPEVRKRFQGHTMLICDRHGQWHPYQLGADHIVEGDE